MDRPTPFRLLRDAEEARQAEQDAVGRAIADPMRAIADELRTGPLLRTQALLRDREALPAVAGALAERLHAQLMEAASLAERIARLEERTRRGLIR